MHQARTSRNERIVIMGNLALRQDRVGGDRGDVAWFRPRKHLISRLLENRKVVRIIVAPACFGKTTLARSYARQVFREGEVTWVDGSDPMFLCNIDQGSLGEGILEDIPVSSLLVIDDLPYLDEMRKGIFMGKLQTLLERGVEVICTVVPSNDVLSPSIHDAVVLGPRDLLVRRQEVLETRRTAGRDLFAVDADNIDRVRGLMSSKRRGSPLKAGRALLPAMTWGIPSLVWGDLSYAAGECLRGFFEEHLPREFNDVALSMTLLGSGSFQQLSDLGVTVSNEAIDILKTRYPLFGIDELRRTFDSIPVQVADLVRFEVEVPPSWREGQGVIEGIATMLLDRGSYERALEVSDAYLPSSSACRLMMLHGAELLDNGLASKVARILDRFPRPHDGDAHGLVHLHLWSLCLSGRLEEARRMLAGDGGMCRDPGTGVLSWLFDLGGGDGLQMKPGEPVSRPNGAASMRPCALQCLRADAGGCPSGITGDDRRHRARCTALQLLGHLTPKEGGCGVHGVLQQALTSFLREMADECPPALWRLVIHAVLARIPQAVDDALLGAAVMGGGERSITRALLVVDTVMLGRLSPGYALRSGDDIQARSLLEPYLGNRGTLITGTHGGGSPFLRLFEKVRSVWGADDDSGGIVDLGPGPLRTSGVVAAQPGRPRLYLKLFGTFEVFDGEERLDNQYIAKRQVREMLAYLVLGKGRELSRERLFCEMWPSSDMVRARNSFYIVWGNMRRALSLDDHERRFIDLREDTIAINPELVGSDVFRFDELQRELIVSGTSLDGLIGVFTELERVYAGDLLGSGFDNEYFEGMRERYRESFVDAMVNASRVAYAQGKAAVALWFARKSIEYGPYREDTYESLILAQLSSGQTISALRSYRRYRTVLAEGFGVAPSDEVRRLFEQMAPGMLRHLDEEAGQVGRQGGRC